jgi:PAS domain S-box-containing protein
MLYDEQGGPDDFVYLAVNEAFGRLTGLKNVVGKRATEVIPRIKELNPELFEIYGRVASTNKPERFEIDFKPLGLYLSVSAYCPEPGHFVAVFDDISERKQAELRLRQAKEEWERTFDSVPDPIAVLDRAHRVRRVNRAMADRLGVTPEQCVGLHCHEAVHGLGAPPAFCPHMLTCADGQTHTVEVHEERLGGHFLVTTTPLRDEQGRVLGSVHVARDITARKRAEEALRASHERLKKVLEVETVGVMFWDLKTGYLTDANDTFLKMTGYSRGDLEAHLLSWQKFAPPEYQEVGLVGIRKFQATGRVGPYEKECVRKDGTRQWLLFAGSSLGDDTCVEFCVDISAQKNAEAALQKAHDELEKRIAERTAQLNQTTELARAERQRFYHVLETLPAYVCLMTPDYRIAFANRIFREWFGHSLNRKCYEFLFDRDQPCERCQTYSVLKTNAPHRWEWTGPNGRTYDVFDFPFIDTDGARLILEMGIDITERKQAEKALQELNETLEQRVAQRTAELRQSREDLDRAQAVGQIGWWRLDTRKNVLTWSPESHRIFGVPEGTPMSYESFLSIVHRPEHDFHQGLGGPLRPGERGPGPDIRNDHGRDHRQDGCGLQRQHGGGGALSSRRSRGHEHPLHQDYPRGARHPPRRGSPLVQHGQSPAGQARRHQRLGAGRGL